MPRISRLKAFVSVFALLPVLGLAIPQGQAAPPAKAPKGTGDAASCRAMAGRIVGPDMRVVTAEYDETGTTVGDTQIDVPLCRIVGVAYPTADSRIGFEVWMPAAASWNGKFQAEGSGGSAGAISPGPMLTALKAGYATMSTDNGHVTNPDAPNGGGEQTWALGHPEKMIDFAYRALHVSTIAAKEIVQDFYGKKASESYFVGCSQGGHHALMEATRFPDDYDGIVAGAPAWHWANQMINASWNSRAALLDPTALTEESAALLNRRVIAACDALDGVKDGVIEDPRQCHFDPASLVCKAGDAAGECLTPGAGGGGERDLQRRQAVRRQRHFHGLSARQRSAMGEAVGGRGTGRLGLRFLPLFGVPGQEFRQHQIRL